MLIEKQNNDKHLKKWYKVRLNVIAHECDSVLVYKILTQESYLNAK